MADRTVKTWLEGDVRRFALTQEDSVSFAKLTDAVCKVYSLRRDAFSSRNDYVLQYTDEEEDLINVRSDEELEEAWRNTTDNILRMQIQCKNPNSALRKEGQEEKEMESTNDSSAEMKEVQKEDSDSSSDSDSDSSDSDSSDSESESESDTTDSDSDPCDSWEEALTTSLGKAFKGLKGKIKPVLQKWKEQAKNRRREFRAAAQAKEEELAKEGNGTPEDQSAAEAEMQHPGIVCDGCNVAIIGSRFHCLKCPDYDLCGECEAKGIHPNHPMLRIRVPGKFPRLVRNGLPWFRQFRHERRPRGCPPFFKRGPPPMPGMPMPHPGMPMPPPGMPMPPHMHMPPHMAGMYHVFGGDVPPFPPPPFPGTTDGPTEGEDHVHHPSWPHHQFPENHM